MRAILICENNRAAIAASSLTLTDEKLDAMILEYGFDDSPDLFFVPDYNEGIRNLQHTWATLPGGFISGRYNYDAEKIRSEFVEITPK